jgi:alkylation response protein AidB-like acyl-CoA dehydrogenase
MDFGLTPEQSEFLDRFRSYLDGWEQDGAVPELLIDIDHDHSLLDARKALIRRLGRDGWLAAKWPAEYGGEDRSHIEAWLINEELAYRGLPSYLIAVIIQAPILMRMGTEEQQRRFLPGILSGEIEFALGYSEPNAGSDLASLQTSAVRDGDEYVINGQKIWTSFAHCASHVWLAARTGTPDSRHRGISVFIVDLASPGVAIEPIDTQAGYSTNYTFYDDVRVSAADRIGEENEGWKVIMAALDTGRSYPYMFLVREFEDLVRWTLEHERDGRPVAQDPLARAQLAEIAVDIEVARMLSTRSAWMLDAGEIPQAEASVNKVWNSDTAQRLGAVGVNLMGEDAQLKLGAHGAPNRGRTEHLFRRSPVFRFAGGTNEIQRNIIAQHGLGMARPKR